MINKNYNKINKKSLRPNNQKIIKYKNPTTKAFPQTIDSESADTICKSRYYNTPVCLFIVNKQG